MSGPPGVRGLAPALDRAVLAARDRRERRGAAGDGKFSVPAVTAEEALALDALLGVSARRQPVLPGRALTLRLSEFESAVRACGLNPVAEYERVGGRPLRDLPADRAAARSAREDFRTWLLDHDVLRSRPHLADWVGEAASQGRLHTGMRALIQSAFTVVHALPAPAPLQRTVLAARLLDGDPHALDVGTPLHGLVVAMLAAIAGGDDGSSPRAVWAEFNVLVDPASSSALTLGLPLLGDGTAARLVRAAEGGHVILTHGQLASGGFSWPAGVPCFTCENPSVLIAAEQALGIRCRPLICTGGHPSDAVRLLLSAIAQAGGTIHHHGDFDAAGALIFRDLESRYGARPWRFDSASLAAALGGRGELAVDVPTHASPSGSPSLESAISALRRSVPEELLLAELLSDLAR